jgi:hypothetical protein
MKTGVGRCAICDEEIWMDLPSDSGGDDPELLRSELAAVAEDHLRSHPAPEHARFWLRRHLDELSPGDRAVAVKRIYAALRSLWGDEDIRGSYAIDEALGSASIYRLWLAANRCSYGKCRHREAVKPGLPRPSDGAWRSQLLARYLPPAQWKGTAREWRQLMVVVTRNCTCSSRRAQTARCGAHRLLADPASLDRLVFGRRLARRLIQEEFSNAQQAGLAA